MATRTLTALYDSKDAAERAKDQLKAAGVDHVDIHNENAGEGLTDAARSAGQATRGLLDRIADFFGGHHEDTHAYAEGLRRGHYLLTARVDDATAQAASSALNASGAVDFEQAQDSWRAEGWAPGQRAYDQGASTATSGGAGDTRGTAGAQEQLRRTSAGLAGASAATAEDFGQPATDTAQIQPEIPAQSSTGYAAGSTADTSAASLEPSTLGGGSEFGQPASTGAQVQPQTPAETTGYGANTTADPSRSMTSGGDSALERVTDGASAPKEADRKARREDERSNAYVRSYVSEDAYAGEYARAAEGVGAAASTRDAVLTQDTTVRDAFQPKADAAHDLDQGLPASDIKPGGSLNRPA